jgi:glycosyltransferase involved in cell wall biosynthesis
MGTHAYRDRVFAAIDTLRSLRDEGLAATLTVAGPLQWRRGEEEVFAYLRELGLSDAVLLQPAFDQDEAPHLCRAHDILVHPKYLDPCPTVVAEALACGLPVVGSATGGLPEMTDAACARLLPLPLVWDRMLTPSGEQMAAAVADLWRNIESASVAARVCAERKFDAAAWTGAHREIFLSLLSR